MADVTISYNGNDIVAIDDSATKTLQTNGKLMTDDLILNYVKSASGLNYEQGELTLTESSYVVIANFTKFENAPRFFYLAKKEPIYNQNGVNNVSCVKFPFDIITTSNNLLNGISYTIFESRTTYSNYSNPFANNIQTSNVFYIDNTKIKCTCRNNNYPFFAGEYVWYAVE